MAASIWTGHRTERIGAGRALLGAGLFGGLAFWIARLPLPWSAAALGGSALLLAVLILPAAGLVAIGLAIPFGPVLDRFVSLPGVGVVDLLVGLVAAAWLAQGVARRSVVIRRPPLTGFLVVFLWITGCSLTQATSWREGLPEWLKWLEFAAVYLIGCQVVTRRSARWVVAALLAAGVAEALLGAYQFVRQVGPDAFILMGRFMRAYGTFQQPNPYAGYLGYLMPVAASLALAGPGRWWRERRLRSAAETGLYAAVAALLGLGIIMSWSRGAWLGAAAAAVIVVGFRNRRSALLTLSAVIVLALLITVTGTAELPGFIGARLNDLGSYFTGPDPAHTEITDANFSVLERLAHWQAGLRMFEDRPWLGVGIGNYAVAYPAYQLPHWYAPLGHAHNIFINFLAETGALGAAAFVALWLALPIAVWRRGQRGGTTPPAKMWDRALSIGLLGAWGYITVHSLFDNLFVQHIQLQLALLLCAMFVVSPSAHRKAAGAVGAGEENA